MTLGIRKIIVISLIGLVFLAGNILIIANWLAEKGVEELKYYDFLKQELEKNGAQKNDVMDQFLINISELNKTIKHLQKSYAK